MPAVPRLPLAALVAAALFVPVSVAAQEGAPRPAVVVAPATMLDFEQSASFSGRLVASERVDLRARVSGFIEEIPFREGARAAAGDVLFVIEDAGYRAAVAEIDARIMAAEAERKLASLERERTKTLVDRGTLSQADLDRADASLARAEGALSQLQAARTQADLNLSYTRITAPFDGILGLTAYDVGALVGPDSGPLVTLTKLDPIFVEFPVSTGILLDYNDRVAAGEVSGVGSVTIQLSNGAFHPEPGTLDFIDARVAQGTDTVLVRAEFANPDGRLLDGALVQVVLAATGGDLRVAVPAQAIQRDLAGPFVMVVDGTGTVSQRRVETGPSARGVVAIASGLEEGELVVTEGLNKVRPGVTVDAAPATDG
ncbi:efflux RND transporter periplasmic adaptor subunit [Palleronia sp. KMU-117]|uniref:efflux RND transporter periplasmic adaptor subunit n=1 Tax=Palleronia sp. KMU-117 TaxID=3434108 RepID=UPI003D7300AE